MYRTHWIYIEVLCDIHGDFNDFNDFIIQRYIIYLHATRNDPFMWFMCRDMYHHHGAYGELWWTNHLRSCWVVGTPMADRQAKKKEHKKKHHTRAVKKTWRTNQERFNIFHIIYVAHLLLCLFSHSAIKKHPIYAPMAAPGVDRWRPKSYIAPPIPSTLASSCHEKTFTTCWATKFPGIQRETAKHQHTQNP